MTVTSVFLELATSKTAMDIAMSLIRTNRVEVESNVQRRRRGISEQKLESVKQTNEFESAFLIESISFGKRPIYPKA